MKRLHHFLAARVGLIAIIAMLAVASPTAAHQIMEGSDEEIKKQQMEREIHHAEENVAINNELVALAKEMAYALSDKKFRRFLQQETARSRNTEKILEAKAFFRKAMRIAGKSPGIPQLLDRVMKLSGLIIEAGLKQSNEVGEVDIYFPVEAHRNSWRGGEQLLVSYAPLGEEMLVSYLQAFSVDDNQSLLLDPREPPDIPVLIIAPSEHLTYEDRNPIPTSVGYLKGPEPQSKLKSDNSYFGARYIYLERDHEPWWKGDPEIYSYYMQRAPRDLLSQLSVILPSQSGRVAVESCEVIYEDLPFVNKKKSWYDIWAYSARYFDSRYGDQFVLLVSERDVGTQRVVHLQLYDSILVEMVPTIDVLTCPYLKGDWDDIIFLSLMAASTQTRKSDYPFGQNTTIRDVWNGGNFIKYYKVH